MISASNRMVVATSVVLVMACSCTAAEDDGTEIARKAMAILQANCFRCHGKDGNVEGGMNYLLQPDKLIAHRKIIAGDPDESPLYRRVVAGKMPPAGEAPRPSAADVAVLKQWIENGARSPLGTVQRSPISEAEVYRRILVDLDTIDRRSRRFTRYFSLAHLYNAGLSEAELQTYRNALAKLLNSLSWHPTIYVPTAVDAEHVLLRIDLRHYLWDANVWNRILSEYPYGILQDTAAARACLVQTATRLPFVRADWFVATASHPPLYPEILQLPSSLAELERQLRIDAAADIQQERVARAGFNGSGIAKNNRLIERHVSIHGAYWRSYDFDAVAQNLVDRDNLLPDRRNLFAHPLGPGFTENAFLHAGGEAIFHLPNGLQGYMIVNANGVRLDKASTALVSDPKRPDRAVETGISCMSCHYAGINFKDDQIREYVRSNPAAFSPSDAEVVLALYPPAERMRALMQEDAERFRVALEKTGSRVSVFEPIITMTLRYEEDVDLPTAAAETGLMPEEFTRRLGESSLLTRNLGALRIAGGTVHRPVWVQAFGDVVREMQRATLLQPSRSVQSLPDNTGEIDPLEAQSSPANCVAFSPDGKFALLAGADKSLRLWDVEAGRDRRRLIGHTGSVWCVAFSPDGQRALSGGADNRIRLWDVETGRELKQFEGQGRFVTCVAFSRDSKQALSGSLASGLALWDLENGRELQTVAPWARYIQAVAFSPDGRRAIFSAERAVRLWDLEQNRELGRLDGHTDAVVAIAYSDDGAKAATAGDDGTIRVWDLHTLSALAVLRGHEGPVRGLAMSADGKRLLSGGSDRTVRLWEVASGREVWRSKAQPDGVVGVALTPTQLFAGNRDASVRAWRAPSP